MNRNSKLIKRGLTTSLAVGMSVMVGAMPVYAASSDKKDNDDKLYKEETVYVKADAAGNTDEITVSNWLKNSGDVSGKLTDKSTLNDIRMSKVMRNIQQTVTKSHGIQTEKTFIIREQPTKNFRYP